MEQCESLSLRCRSDNLNAVDVAGAAAQSDEAWEPCERDRVQLRNEHSTLSSRMVACEEELAVGRENERHRRASLRATDDKVATVSRARQAAERRAAGQHDEVCSTVRQVTLFRERLDVARHTLLRREEEFRSDEEKLSTLRTESQRRGHEAAAAAQVYQQLQDSQLALEVALRENVQLHQQVQAPAELRRKALEMGTISGGRQQDVQGKLQSTTEKTTAAEAEFCRWRHCLDSLHKAIAEAKAKHDLLEKDSRGKETVGLSLQEDLQRIFADTEQLRSEHDEAVTTCDEVQKRVRAIEPALEASRRRVRILEDSIEDATAETTRAKQSK
jgi:hypothetical protein